MCALSNIPTTRLSNAFVTQRILTQIQTDQRNLFRVQSQLSGGRRIAAPSDDAPAAMRALSLQSLIERKNTVQSSLQTNQTYLSSSESAVGGVASIVSDLRGLALSVTGNSVGKQERDAALVEIDRALDQLIDTGNQKFRGRFLFAGSQTQVQPYRKTAGGIEYLGNEADLYAYSDIDLLFESNVSGQRVFGGFSEAMRGTADLDPALGFDTKLGDLRGGLGIRKGSIVVSDGTSTSTISLAGAETIGDVARLLEAHPPGNRTLTARVTQRGLDIRLNGGTLSIDEVGGGSTAAELGIRVPFGSGPGPIVGADLNPRVTPLTRVADLLGTRARAYVPATGDDNDLIVEAIASGASRNNVTVKYVDDDWFQPAPGITAGNEFAQFHAAAAPASALLKFPTRPGLDNGLQLTAGAAGAAMNGVAISFTVRAADTLGPQFNYNPATKAYAISVEAGTTVSGLVSAVNSSGGPFTAAITSVGSGAYVLSTADTNLSAGNTYATGNDAGTLAVHIDSGRTTANQVIDAIRAEGTFTASLDVSEDGSDGFGTVDNSWADATATGTTAGGSGENLDLNHGLRITNAGVDHAIDLRKVVTVEDLLNAINGSGASASASINSAGTGIDVRSRLSGASFSIGENGGSAATQLGIRTTTAATPLSSLHGGKGITASTGGPDFSVTRRDGTTFGVELLAGGRASARVAGPGVNSGLLVHRVAAGAAGNAYSVQIVDSGTGGGDAVSLVGNTLRFDVDLAAGFTAQEAIDLVALDSSLSSAFTLRLDRSADATNDGSGNLAATAPTALMHGRDAARTIGDVLDLINYDPSNLASGPPVVARLATSGNGIELVNDGPPGSGSLKVTKSGTGSATTDLGLVAADASVNDDATAGAVASVSFSPAGNHNDFTISAASGGTLLNGVTVRFANDGVAGNNAVGFNATSRVLTIDVDPATTTAQDVVDLLAGHPLFRATLTSNDGGANNGSGTLGSLPADGVLDGGTADVLSGTDPNPQEVDGILSAVLKLRAAVVSGSLDAMTAAVDSLDAGAITLSFARAELGARMQSLDVLGERIESETIGLKGALSKEIDVDFVEAVSELAARQASFDAALQVSAQIAKTTLLDFL